MKLLGFLLLISGCTLFVGGKEAPKTAKGTRYEIDFDKKNWKLQKDKRSDYVFQNEDGRILLSNSFCEEFQEEPLDLLARKTFNSVKNFKPNTEKFTTFNDREAYRMEGSGEVDGVKVNLRLLNTRRDNCYFDFLSISPEGTEKTSGSFNDFLKAVEFK